MRRARLVGRAAQLEAEAAGCLGQDRADGATTMEDLLSQISRVRQEHFAHEEQLRGRHPSRPASAGRLQQARQASHQQPPPPPQQQQRADRPLARCSSAGATLRPSSSSSSSAPAAASLPSRFMGPAVATKAAGSTASSATVIFGLTQPQWPAAASSSQRRVDSRGGGGGCGSAAASPASAATSGRTRVWIGGLASGAGEDEARQQPAPPRDPQPSSNKRPAAEAATRAASAGSSRSGSRSTCASSRDGGAAQAVRTKGYASQFARRGDVVPASALGPRPSAGRLRPNSAQGHACARACADLQVVPAHWPSIARVAH